MSEPISGLLPGLDGDDADVSELRELDRSMDRWLDDHEPSLAALRRAEPDSERRVDMARQLQRALFDGGWAQRGWPEEVGGSGESILARAVICERLTRRGFTTLAMFEHIEILLPTLVRFADRRFLADAGPEFLSGRGAWSQGFSEPDAGSDLASLRTTARQVDGAFRIDGRKVWTSWARHANRCLVLARTGTRESRHRGLSVLVVDLTDPGVEVTPILQADGASDLAEVTFDGVVVGADRLVGELDEGWAVATDVLVHERGTFGWFRHCVLLARLRRLLAHGLQDRADTRALGELLADFVCLRATAISALLDAVHGRESLAKVSACKMQLGLVEQRMYDLVASAFDTDLTLGVLDDLAAVTLQEFQFSRIVTVYGGSQQMQLNAIARNVLGL
jgi:alkylation response protein AidB-like acyl-CoA dehydrogenase